MSITRTELRPTVDEYFMVIRMSQSLMRTAWATIRAFFPSSAVFLGEFGVSSLSEDAYVNKTDDFFLNCLLQVVDVILVVLQYDCEEILGGVCVFEAHGNAGIHMDLYWQVDMCRWLRVVLSKG